MRCSAGAAETSRCPTGAIGSPPSDFRPGAAASGIHRSEKPSQSIGVPTRSGSCSAETWTRPHAIGPSYRVAPIGPDVFPSERRSRYETRVYANLCPFSSVDTSPSTDKLRIGKKGLKTKEFRASWADSGRLGASCSGSGGRTKQFPAWCDEGKAQEKAREEAQEKDWPGRGRSLTRRAQAQDAWQAPGRLCGSIRPASGGSVASAMAWISSPVRSPEPAGPESGIRTVERVSPDGSFTCQVLDCSALFRSSAVSNGRSDAERPGAHRSRDAIGALRPPLSDAVLRTDRLGGRTEDGRASRFGSTRLGTGTRFAQYLGRGLL